MVSLQTVVLCISIALFGLSLQESEAKTHHFNVPPGQDTNTLASPNPADPNAGTHTPHNKHPGKKDTNTLASPNPADPNADNKHPGKNVTHTHKYKTPGHNVTHTYQYKKPGTTHTHHYQYKKPGTTNKHTYHFKNPGKTNKHHYNIPTGEKNPKGASNLVNTIYNYFNVGGHLTGIPPVDLLLLRYYLAQGPKNFCPK